jgi:hypothetical protein
MKSLGIDAEMSLVCPFWARTQSAEGGLVWPADIGERAGGDTEKFNVGSNGRIITGHQIIDHGVTKLVLGRE